jgi:hypothetical protein
MSGLGSFIQGAFSGYEYGENVKDRKTQRERDKENYDWTREGRDQQRTDWDNANATNERNRREQARTDAAASEERSVLAAAGQRATESFNTAPTPDAGPEQAPLDAQAAIEATEAQPAQVGRSVMIDGPQMQQPPQQVQAPVAPQAEQGRQSQLAEQAAMLGEDMRGYGPGMVDPQAYDAAQSAPQGGRSVMQPSKMQDQQIPADVSDAMIDDVYGRLGPMPTDADMNAQIAQASAGQTPAIQAQVQADAVAQQAQQAQQTQQAESDRAQQATESASFRRAVTAAPPSRPAPAPAAAMPAAPAPAQSLPEAAATAVEGQTAEQMHDTAVNAPVDQGGAPSVAIAAETAPTAGRGVLGEDGPVKTTEAQRTRAVTSFLDHYAETAVPEIVQFYASRGDIERAEAFETWATSREARGTMESWAKSVHAASIGDDEAFLDHLGDTFNSFDDGYEVVRDKSGFDRDEEGKIAGATVTFKNTQTGETFERKFEDQADIIEMGIYAMAPERIFDHLFGQLASANEITADALKHQRAVDLAMIRSDGLGEQNTRNAALITSAKKHLSETNFATWSQLSTAEQNEMALEFVRANQSAGAQLGQADAPPPYLGD